MKEIKNFFEEIEKLEIAQGMIDINEAKRLGFGQLIPLVRRRDYELALLSNETA